MGFCCCVCVYVCVNDCAAQRALSAASLWLIEWVISCFRFGSSQRHINLISVIIFFCPIRRNAPNTRVCNSAVSRNYSTPYYSICCCGLVVFFWPNRDISRFTCLVGVNPDFLNALHVYEDLEKWISGGIRSITARFLRITPPSCFSWKKPFSSEGRQRDRGIKRRIRREGGRPGLKCFRRLTPPKSRADTLYLNQLSMQVWATTRKYFPYFLQL